MMTPQPQGGPDPDQDAPSAALPDPPYLDDYDRRLLHDDGEGAGYASIGNGHVPARKRRVIVPRQED